MRQQGLIMSTSRYILARMIMEIQTDSPEEFDEQVARKIVGESIKLKDDDSLIDFKIYLLAGKPGVSEDILIEKYVYRGRKINIMQQANTVGSPNPVYFSFVWSPKETSGKLVEGNYFSVDDAKGAAEKETDKLVQRQEKRDMTLSKLKK